MFVGPCFFGGVFKPAERHAWGSAVHTLQDSCRYRAGRHTCSWLLAGLLVCGNNDACTREHVCSMTGNGRAAPLQGEAGRFLVVLLLMPVTLDFRTILSSLDSPLAGVTRLTSVTITSSWNVSLSVGFFSEALVLARVLDEGGIAISIHERSAPGEGR